MNSPVGLVCILLLAGDACTKGIVADIDEKKMERLVRKLVDGAFGSKGQSI